MRKLLISLIFLLSVGVVVARATDDEQLYQDYQSKQNKIVELEGKIDESKGKQKTLANTIDYLNDKISLAELQIDQTESDLKKLQEEISVLVVKIDRLDENLDSISQVLVERVGASYKRHYIKPMYLFLSSGGFAEFFERNKYLKAAQKNDRQLLLEMQNSRDSHQSQKDIKENKQEEVEDLQASLQTQNDSLASQKSGKQELLNATRNDERRFQTLLTALQIDLQSINRALSREGIKLGEVAKGERIAGVGNSGCSTGYHLHLEVMKPAHVEEQNGKYYIIGRDNKVDPLSYIQSNAFPKPTSSYSGGDCSQGGTCNYGDITTRFNQWYEVLGGSYHTGLDIADHSGAGIYAAAKGKSYLFSDSKSCSLTGTVGKGIVIDHDDADMVTLYWHIP